MNQNEFDALVSFTYNLGTGNLKRLTDNRKKNEISEGMKLYNKAGGKKLQGLVNRRNEESELFNEPIESYSSSNSILHIPREYNYDFTPSSSNYSGYYIGENTSIRPIFGRNGLGVQFSFSCSIF